jgi:hypothetical protein
MEKTSAATCEGEVVIRKFSDMDRKESFVLSCLVGGLGETVGVTLCLTCNHLHS